MKWKEGGRGEGKNKGGGKRKWEGERKESKKGGREGERLIIWRYISLSSNAVNYDKQPVI